MATILHNIYREYMALTQLAMKMRDRGVLANPQNFGGHRKKFVRRRRVAKWRLRTIANACGWKKEKAWNPNSKADLAWLFFDQLKVQPTHWSEETGQPALNVKALQKLIAGGNPLVQVAARQTLSFRRWQKLLSTYIDGLPMDKQHVVHPVWKVYGCVPMHTQALTKDGWKTADQLKVGDEILAYDAARDVKCWTPILDLSRYASAPVVRSFIQGFSVESTPNHRWYGDYRGYGKPGQNRWKPEVRTTSQLQNNDYRIVRNAPLAEEDREGTLPLKELKPKWDTNWIPLVTRMSHAQRVALLQGFCLADGWDREGRAFYDENAQGNWNWVQNKGNIADAMEIVSYLVHDATVSLFNKEGSSPQTVARLCTRRYSHTTYMQQEYLGEQPVWCPTTKYGTWVMRQGNCITITGNTITGRWSSEAPNMQNIPKPRLGVRRNGDKYLIAPGLRDLFWARPGRVLIECDYSQLELRIIALLSGDEKLLEAYAAGKDVHTLNCMDLFGEVNKSLRDLAKRFVYGVNYGGDAKTIWASLVVDYPSLTVTQVQRMKDAWYKAHPAIAAWQEKQLSIAREHGYVEIPTSGRREYFHDGIIEANKVLNFPVQGTAADVINPAALELERIMDWDRNSILLQVHDALVVEARDYKKIAGAMKEAMEREVNVGGAKLRFPVDFKIGRDWGNAQEVPFKNVAAHCRGLLKEAA